MTVAAQSEVSCANVRPHTHTHTEQWACPGGGDGEDKRRRGLLICLTPNQLLGSSAPPLHHSSSSSSSVLSHTGERFPLFLRRSFISSLLHTFISRSAGGLPSPNISLHLRRLVLLLLQSSSAAVSITCSFLRIFSCALRPNLFSWMS